MTTESGTPRDDRGLPAFGLFVLALFGVMLASNLTREVPANYCYVEGRCVLLDRRVHEDPDGGGGLYRPEFLIRYAVDGREYEVWAYDAVRAWTAWRWPKERILERFTVGQEYPCWYDPADPSQVVLVRGYRYWTYGLLAIVVVVVTLTGRGVLQRLRSIRSATDEASGTESGSGRTRPAAADPPRS